ncbi:flagellar biosynthetic protein FliR [Yersinia massiliensis]|jgi:flagellar biosynthetic protein FliR|uniref:Flagellar biosynthetic protein FliR n=4 Tax=Yersinia TaxID=629 RepID=A0A2R4NL86_9GAMM|nr:MULTISPECIES: flagellar biosynthetic protein FliR [Yersinia]HEC1650678.1 flagellar type III secretion system protein FliR [Yersinia enterocolitica]ATM87303.1 flagellar type III secretion system protein FliR [Yersinia frederiksenii]AVX36892.1 flagellar type III secretion system protein FliR [Yersinia massiliensis]MCB5317886.1 flagellar type III secretion system protein FliR [Yersinia massiliensis]MDA5548959.1 flagellar biosynthetic protein FliR [Yersinia massiliensis]
MLTLSVASLYPYINHYFWPFLRILALFSSAPIYNEKEISGKLKVGLALILTFLIAPNLPESDVKILSISGLWVGIQQVIIGIAMGFIVQFIFVAVRHGGELVGLQMGLSFATFYDHSGGQNMPVIARILNLLVTLLFLYFNGHLLLIDALAASFDILPVKERPLEAGGFMALVQASGVIFKSGMMLALPVVALLLCLNLIMGILNRLTPQLSIFVVGFPLSLSIGMFALSLIMYSLSPFFESLINSIFESLSVVLISFA